MANSTRDVSINLADLSLAGLDERLRALRPVVHSGNYYDLDVQCAVATENNNGLMTSEQVAKLASLSLHPNLGPNYLSNPDFPNYTHDIDEIKRLQPIAKTGLLSDLPGTQIASRSANGLMSKDDFARLYDTHTIAHSGLFNDLEFNDGYKSRLNTTGYMATNLKDGFMRYEDKITFDDFFGKDIHHRHSLTHPTGAGYNHVPAGGTSSQILVWGQGDVAVWQNPVVYNAGSYLSVRSDGTYNRVFDVVTGTTSSTVSRGDHRHDSDYYRLGVINKPSNNKLDISNSSGSQIASLGIGTNGDIYIANTLSTGVQVSLQLKNDGSVRVNDMYTVYHSGNLGGASQSVTGLLSASDKQKLDSIAWHANNFTYTHPGTHPASMITGLSTVATSGSYNDLSNKPTYIDGASYADRIKISGTARTVTVSGTTLTFS